MDSKCRQAIRLYNMLCPGDSVIVGLSGGADSCALLHFLCSIREEYALSITAVHVNHMIRGEEAERDAAFAEELCRQLCVGFRLYTANIPAIAEEKGIGLEECGREVRYGIFQEEAEKCGGKIATAHTLSDSVETVLFHVIRGCAVNGLKGIPPVRGNIIRPLILCERADIEAYCRKHSIGYMTDSTNLTADYARNKIRLQILPLMRELNPSVNEAIGRLSESAREDDAFIGRLAAEISEEYLSAGCSDGLFSESAPVVSRALTNICREKFCIVPEQKHISSMLHSLSRGAGSVNLPGNYFFTVRGKRAIFSNIPEKSNPNSFVYEEWVCKNIMGEIITPLGQKINPRIIDKNIYNELVDKNNVNYDEKVFKNCLDYDKLSEAVFRCRREGDRFSPAGRHCTKSLKKLFNEEKIPSRIRGELPLLESGGMIAWISLIGVSENFRVTETTARVLYIEDISFKEEFRND